MRSALRGRRLLVAGAVPAVLALVAALLSGDSIEATTPQACQRPDRQVTLYAERLPDTATGEIRIGWGLAPGRATIPGPTMEMVEGECLAVTVVNTVDVATLSAMRDHATLGSRDPRMPLGVSLHVHGVKYTQASDGTFPTDSWVAPGASRTYTWYASPRVVTAGRVTSQGTAGYWWYHDHVVGTDHGTGGLASGLFGGLVVRRPGDLEPDHTFVVAMGPNATINLKKWPDVGTFRAREGQRVEFLVIGIGDDFHTFHLHGHNWANNRTGILTSQLDETRLIDNRTIGPADSFGFQVIAGQEVGGGEWMLHCHVQTHSDAGMFTFFDVEPTPGGPVPQPALKSGGHHDHFGRG